MTDLPDSVIKAGGFKVDWKKYKETYLECELNKNSNKCKSLKEELGIDWAE